MGLIEGDTRSLDSGSHEQVLEPELRKNVENQVRLCGPLSGNLRVADGP